jgi:hypothetical protein
MCDYSLGGLPNRLAVEGEELVVHRFRTHSIGLASPGDLGLPARSPCGARQSLWQRIQNFLDFSSSNPDAPAVCVPPGARLTLKNIPLNLQQEWQIGEQENAVFVQTSARANTYRDALCFSNGTQVSLQRLSEGMRAIITSLGGDATVESEPMAATRAFAHMD